MKGEIVKKQQAGRCCRPLEKLTPSTLQYKMSIKLSSEIIVIIVIRIHLLEKLN